MQIDRCETDVSSRADGRIVHGFCLVYIQKIDIQKNGVALLMGTRQREKESRFEGCLKAAHCHMLLRTIWEIKVSSDWFEFLSTPRMCSRNRSPRRLPFSPMYKFLQHVVQIMQWMTLAVLRHSETIDFCYRNSKRIMLRILVNKKCLVFRYIYPI